MTARGAIDGRPGRALAALACVALVAAIYWPSFFSQPVFDDTDHVAFAARYGADLGHIGPVFFRPIERALIGLDWTLDGLHFWIVRSVALLTLLGQAALVGWLAGRIVPADRTLARLAIPVLFLAHPMHVAAVDKIDTLSETLAAFFALAAVAVVVGLSALPPGPIARRKVVRVAAAAGILTLLGMLSKESFAGIALILPVLAVIALESRTGARTFAFLSFAAAGAVAASVYLPLRAAAGFALFASPGARYHLALGANVAKNLAAGYGAILYPGSTLRIFVHPDPLYVAISLALVAALAVGGRRSFARFARLVQCAGTGGAETRALLVVGLAALAAAFPTVLIPELISEHQTALPLPFVMLLALAIPAAFGPSPPRAFAVALGVLALAWMATASSEKALAVKAQSDRARALAPAALEAAAPVTAKDIVACAVVDPAHDRPKYGIFSIPDALAAGFQLYRLRLDRPARELYVVTVPAGTKPPAECDLVLATPRLQTGRGRI